MKNAIILHGMPTKQQYYATDGPSESNNHWLPWLQKQLMIRDIAAATPEVPMSFRPEWETWKTEVERFELKPETIAVGHSCGAGFWVRYLSENPDVWLGTVVLVAPWMDPGGDETDGFFDFKIDPSLLQRVRKLIVFNSDNDMGNVLKSVAALREAMPGLEYREFHGYGHFTSSAMKTDEFPELLEAVLSSV